MYTPTHCTTYDSTQPTSAQIQLNGYCKSDFFFEGEGDAPPSFSIALCPRKHVPENKTVVGANCTNCEVCTALHRNYRKYGLQCLRTAVRADCGAHITTGRLDLWLSWDHPMVHNSGSAYTLQW